MLPTAPPGAEAQTAGRETEAAHHAVVTVEEEHVDRSGAAQDAQRHPLTSPPRGPTRHLLHQAAVWGVIITMVIIIIVMVIIIIIITIIIIIMAIRVW